MNKGDVVLVTGASAGIGKATAELLAKRGYRVICAARRLDRIRALAKRIGGHALHLDLADAESCARLLKRLPPAWRKIAVLVNNAGSDTGGRVPFENWANADFEQTVDVNLTGLMRATKAVLPAMRGRGQIVNIGSQAGRAPYKGASAYAATKAAVHVFGQVLRMELADRGIKVTNILPGLVQTEFAQVRYRGDAAKAAAFYAEYKTKMKPEDIARAVLYALDQPERVTIAELLIVPSS